MMQNNFFSFKRFCFLFRKDFLENWKTLLLHFVTLFVLLTVIFCFICKSDCDSMMHFGRSNIIIAGTKYISFALGLFWALGCFWGSNMFSKMQSKITRISFLMTPATSFEKFLSGFIQIVLLYLVAIFVVFKLGDYTRVAVFTVFYPGFKILPSDLSLFVVQNGVPDWWPIWGMFSIYLFFQSLFIIGSILWYKKPFIKTIGLGLAIYLIFLLINSAFIDLLYADDMNDFVLKSNSFLNCFDDSHIWRYSIVFFSCFTLFNWALAYFRFKESEIINRI